MKRIFEGFLIVLLLAAPAAAQMRDVRVAVFGDSLTAGYRLQPEEAFPARLERKLKEVGFSNVSVINMSVPNDTTAGGLDRLHDLELQHPDIVIIELGTNDAMRGIQVKLIQQNLETMVEKLKPLNAYVVLIGARPPASLGADYAAQLDKAYRNIAQHYKLPFYPFVLEGVMGQQNLNLADGLHPNAKGVDVMVSRIYPLVDTGLRWKIQVLQYEQDYNNYQQQPSPAQR